MSKPVQIALYGLWFSIVFGVSVYLSLPLDQLKPKIVDAVEVQLGRGSPVKVGRYGTNPEFKLGKLSPWRLSGVEATRVHVQLASRNADPGLAFDLDEVRVRAGILSLLSDELEVAFDVDLYEGNATGTVLLDKEAVMSGKAGANAVRGIDAEISGVKLDKFGPLLAKLGVPVSGTIDGVVDLHLGAEPNTEGEGVLDLKVSRVTLGPGELKVYGPITTEIPLIDVGELVVKLPIKEGKGKTEAFDLSGRDGDAKVDLDLTLSKRLDASRMDMKGSFLISEKFLKDNPKFQGALGFLPGVDKAKDKDGRIHFLVAGSVSNPRPSLSKNGGKDAPKKRRGRRSRRSPKK
jgi:type II secretion system protein N